MSTSIYGHSPLCDCAVCDDIVFRKSVRQTVMSDGTNSRHVINPHYAGVCDEGVKCCIIAHGTTPPINCNHRFVYVGPHKYRPAKWMCELCEMDIPEEVYLMIFNLQRELAITANNLVRAEAMLKRVATERFPHSTPCRETYLRNIAKEALGL